MKILPFVSLSFILLSCKGKSSSVAATSTNDTIQFFQVAEFVKGQVKDVNNTPYYIYKKTVSGKKEDSVKINNKEFDQLANQFVYPDINTLPLKREYTETGFFDQTTKTYTLNYSTKNKELEVQTIDVILQEDAQTVKRIFIRKYVNYKSDSTSIEQLSWKPDNQFQISRLVQKPDKTENTTQTTVVWNDKQ